ncbi:O-antigen ligase family protein [Sphingomonas qilianensis]|uniref:O-antigen ligase family protein n=1 Tax=Sphingomonas qilianensis TaxID=1736690 RepID=A0ABU9XNL8_9SPHN
MAIIGVLVWAMLEGAVRKWILPEFQSQILLVKDFVLFCAYGGYLIAGRKHLALGTKSGTLLILVLLEAIFCSLQLLNPNAPSKLLSLFGLKNYLIYIPLAFILPEIITDRAKLDRLLLWTCYLAIPISLLGLYQFSQPPSSWVNQYVSHEEGVQALVSVFGERGEGDFKYGRARTSGTFSYIGGFTTFLMMAVPLAAALLLASVPKRRTLLLVTAALALSIGAAATTGSRTPIFVFAASIPLMLIIAAWKRLLPPRIILRIVIGSTIAGILTVFAFGGAFSALQYRANNADSTMTRLASPFVETAAAYATSPFIGTGLGSNSNASTTFMGSDPWWLNGYAYEMESARIMQELGVIGFIVVYLPKIFIIILILLQLHRARARLMIATQTAALIFVLSHLVLFTVNNPTGGLLYWSIVGIAIAARRIERFEQRIALEEQHYLAHGFPVREVAFA